MCATFRHEQSNRSHCIVRVTQESREDGDTELRHVLRSSLLLVDLAGSETVSDNQGKAAAEGKAIVKSLFWLRRCIHALSSGQRPDFRSSKLTRLLEPSLIHGRQKSLFSFLGCCGLRTCLGGSFVVLCATTD